MERVHKTRVAQQALLVEGLLDKLSRMNEVRDPHSAHSALMTFIYVLVCADF
jgi:hypothetical protein